MLNELNTREGSFPALVSKQLLCNADLYLRGQVSPLPALARVGGSLVVKDAGHRHHDHLG